MNMTSKMVAVFLLLCLLLTACGSPTPAPTTVPAATQSDHYTVKVQDADGNPIAGALVAMCQNVEGGICYLPATTDENGVVEFLETVVPVQSNMKVRVLAAEGFDLPLDDTGDIRYTLVPDGTTEITLILEKLS